MERGQRAGGVPFHLVGEELCQDVEGLPDEVHGLPDDAGRSRCAVEFTAAPLSEVRDRFSQRDRRPVAVFVVLDHSLSPGDRRR